MKWKKINVITIIALTTLSFGILLYRSNNENINFNYKDNENNGNRYDASTDINKALNLLEDSNKSAILTDVETSKNLISLSFEDIKDDDTLLKTLELLKKYKFKATFFVSGINCAENPEIVNEIKSCGHEIGSATLYNKKNIDEMDSKEIIKDFSKANKIIESSIGEKPELLKFNSREYTDDILSIAYACDNKYVVKSNHYLNDKSFKNYEQASAYIRSLKNGTILSIKDDALDKNEYESKKDDSIAIDKQAGLSEKADEINNQVTILEVIEWVLKALDEQERKVVKVSEFKNMTSENKLDFMNVNKENSNKYYVDNNNLNSNIVLDMSTNENTNLDEEVDLDESKPNFSEFIERNNGKESKINSEIYTTANKLTYTFRGIKDDEILNNVLNALNEVNAKATFFVTKEEIQKYPERIDKILKYGHEIANGGISTGSYILEKSTQEICSEIYELFTYSKSPVNSRYKDMTAEEIISEYFTVNTYLSLRKGEIVYFRLDSDIFYDKNKIADMIRILTNGYVKNGHINKYNSITQGYDLMQKPLNYSVDSLSNNENMVYGKKYKIAKLSDYLR